MAVTREVLQLLLAQHRRIDKLLDGRTLDLISAWAGAWDATEQETEAAVTRLLADHESVSARVAAVKSGQAQNVIQNSLHQLLNDAQVPFGRDIRDLVGLAGEDQAKLISLQLTHPAVAGLFGNLVRTDPHQISAMIERSLQKFTSRTWLLEADTRARMQEAMVRSVVSGWNPEQAAAWMIKGIKDQHAASLAHVVTIMRTEQMDAYRNAARESWKANEDILGGWQWVAELGPRTCRACIALHGQIFPLSERGPDDHPNGRCTGAPVTKTWAELGFRDIPETRMEIGAGTGENWLRSQPVSVQQHILGQRGQAAWSAGQWPSTEWAVHRDSVAWRGYFTQANQPKVSETPGYGAGPFKSMTAPLDPKDKKAWQSYWLERQNAIPLGFKGDVLYPHEIEAVERLLRRGEAIDWIARIPSVATNDFEWLNNNGKPTEMKSPTEPDYLLIRRAITEAVKGARKHDVVKDVFLVDLGVPALGDDLRSELRNYNLDRTKYPIAELWVMSDDGAHLEQIALHNR